MNHAEFWKPVTARLTDGREVEALQYESTGRNRTP